jgi:hypothetical protein
VNERTASSSSFAASGFAGIVCRTPWRKELIIGGRFTLQSIVVDSLWSILHFPTIDPLEFTRLAREVVIQPDLDYRTVQLLHEISEAIPELQADSIFTASLDRHRREVRLDTSSVGFSFLKRKGIFAPVVDVRTIPISKFFSARPKDQDDLRRLTRFLDQREILARIQECHQMLEDHKLSQNLRDNWYIIYGEEFNFGV